MYANWLSFYTYLLGNGKSELVLFYCTVLNENIIQMLLYLFLATRLYITFKGSVYSYSKWLLIPFCCVILFCWLSWSIAMVMFNSVSRVQYTDQMTGDTYTICETEATLSYSIFVVVWDIFASFVLSYSFIHRLRQVCITLNILSMHVH